jgi:RNA polymerase sporulation-specific sigma factor
MKKMTEEQRQLVEDNIRLAGYMAHKWKKRGTQNFEFDDIFSLFSYGLCKAAKTFDATKGAKFATYAGRCMENELKMAFRKKSRLGGENSEINLGTPINTDGDGNELILQDVISDNKHLEYDKVLDIMYAKEAMKILKPRDIVILQKKFYLNQKQKVIAESLNISQSYVSRIEKVILKRLRDWGEGRSQNKEEVS